MQRVETRFGAATVGTTYTSLGTVGTGKRWNVSLSMANRTAAAVTVQVFIAASGWSSGEPTGATLVSAVFYDFSIGANAVVEKSGFVLNAGEKLVVRAGTAASVDMTASGVEITL